MADGPGWGGSVKKLSLQSAWIQIGPDGQSDDLAADAIGMIGGPIHLNRFRRIGYKRSDVSHNKIKNQRRFAAMVAWEDSLFRCNGVQGDRIRLTRAMKLVNFVRRRTDIEKSSDSRILRSEYAFYAGYDAIAG